MALITELKDLQLLLDTQPITECVLIRIFRTKLGAPWFVSGAIKTLVGVSSSSNDLVKKVELPQKMKKSTSPKNMIHCFPVEKGCCWKSGTYQHQLGPLMGQTNGKVLKHYSPDWGLAHTGHRSHKYLQGPALLNVRVWMGTGVPLGNTHILQIF